MSLSVVVAPDSFKGSLTARRAAAAIEQGWRDVRPADEVRLLPQADGGEGTLDAIEAAVAGAVRHRVTAVSGPDGRPVAASWLELPGPDPDSSVAVVELAESSGLPLMQRLDPLGATTRGLGEVIAAALDAGAGSLLIGLGGSASTDGGRGALEALGLLVGAAGPTATRVDRSTLRSAPTGGVTLLTDVTAPLLGPTGAAAVFGPQKGATAEQVIELERRLEQWAALLGGDPSDATAAGAGAAGGTAFGFATVWGATITSGADYLAQLAGLDAALASADVVLTGEGRFDAQSLTGKVVGRVLARASARTVVLAGDLAIAPPDLGFSLTELAGSTQAAVADPERWLREAAAAAARRIDERPNDLALSNV